ncbi:MAG: hypothetical protein CVU23_11880 [Betaproteobacteria bacterium HGW-Betaproteobacteria-17]|nr:MAG: hypothetical protein CVU23_11880 [Betaproteobacteria bacterium HGW-Betaproteobacteria-17]
MIGVPIKAQLGFVQPQLRLDGNANHGEHHPDHEAHRERQCAHDDDRPCLVGLRCHKPPLGLAEKIKRLQGVFYANDPPVSSGCPARKGGRLPLWR